MFILLKHHESPLSIFELSYLLGGKASDKHCKCRKPQICSVRVILPAVAVKPCMNDVRAECIIQC